MPASTAGAPATAAVGCGQDALPIPSAAAACVPDRAHAISALRLPSMASVRAERRCADADRTAGDRIASAEIGGKATSSEAADSEAATTGERARGVAANVLQRRAFAELLERLPLVWREAARRWSAGCRLGGRPSTPMRRRSSFSRPRPEYCPLATCSALVMRPLTFSARFAAAQFWFACCSSSAPARGSPPSDELTAASPPACRAIAPARCLRPGARLRSWRRSRPRPAPDRPRGIFAVIAAGWVLPG